MDAKTQSELMSEAGNPARGCVWGLIFSAGLWIIIRFVVWVIVKLVELAVR